MKSLFPRLYPALYVGGLCCPLLAMAEPRDYLDLSIEELMQVKITAQKREESLYETPLSIDVFDGHNLRDNNIHRFRELSGQTPGLLYGQVGNTPNIYLRGIGSDLLSVAADASTASYLDDVYLARPEMAVAHFWDVERIEILKGPQGALYGRNATGGAINIINTKPSFEQAEGYIRANTGSFSSRQIESAAGTPISDALAMRASFFALDDAGFTRDVDPHGSNSLDDNHVAAARFSLSWRPSSQIQSDITLDHYRNNYHGFSLKPLDNKGLAQQLGAQSIHDIHSIANNLPSYSDYTTQGVNWHWIWHLTGLEFHSISAYRTLDTSYLLNTDGTEVPVTESQIKWQEEQRTQEFRLVSTGSGDLHWLAGATWLDESPTLDVGLIRHPLNTSIDIFSHASTHAWAIYGELDWAFHPQWNVKLGLRNSEETRKDGNQLYNTHDLEGLNSTLQQATSSGAANHDQSSNKLSPQFVLSFTPRENCQHCLWYFSATEGFKSGGANSLSTRPSFKPEQVVSFESGYKYSEANLAWQLAAFHYDYTDLQVVSFENGATTITNAASASLTGADSHIIFALDSHWHWSLGATLLNAHYNTFITSLAGKAVDVSGNRMPYAPKLDFNQELSFQQPVSNGKILLTLQHQYQALTYFNQFADKTVSSSGHHLFNLMTSWKIDDHWEVGGQIYNLTNSNYFSNITRFTSTSIPSAPEGNALGIAAPGRQLMGTVNYHF